MDKIDKNERIIARIVLFASSISAIVTIVISILFALWVDTPILSSKFIDPSIFGQYGDALSGIAGTILTFLSIYLIYKTYQSQKEELQATHKALYEQKNETAIFNMLSTLRQIITEMEGEVNIINPQSGRSELKQLKGREYFHYVLDSIRRGFTYEHLNNSELIFNPATGKLHEYREERTGKFDEHGNEGVRKIPMDSSYSIEGLKEEIGKSFLKEFDKYSYNFDHYFRYFRGTVGFINNVNLEDYKIRYFEMLKSQLSQDELVMLFYFTITSDEKFLRIIDSNEILNPILNKTFMIDLWHHWQLPCTDFKFLSLQELEFKKSYRERKHP